MTLTVEALATALRGLGQRGLVVSMPNAGTSWEGIAAAILAALPAPPAAPHRHRWYRPLGSSDWHERCALCGTIKDDAALAAPLTVEALATALRRIRALCDLSLDDMREQHGSEQRVLMAVIPTIVDEAIAALPAPPAAPEPDGPVWITKTCPVCHKYVAVRDEGSPVIHEPSHEAAPTSEQDRLAAIGARTPEWFQQMWNGVAECVICGGRRPGSDPDDPREGHRAHCPFVDAALTDRGQEERTDG